MVSVLGGYTAQPAPEQPTADLGNRRALTGTGIKPFPSCRLTHGATDAPRQVGAASAAGAVVAAGEFEAVISPDVYAIVGGSDPRERDPLNTVDAQFSVYLQIASALLGGNVTWASYRRVLDAALRASTPTITVTAEEGLQEAGARLSWRLPDGTQSTDEPGSGLPWELVESKFHAAASTVYDGETRRELVAGVRTLHQADAVSHLVCLLAAAN